MYRERRQNKGSLAWEEEEEEREKEVERTVERRSFPASQPACLCSGELERTLAVARDSALGARKAATGGLVRARAQGSEARLATQVGSCGAGTGGWLQGQLLG